MQLERRHSLFPGWIDLVRKSTDPMATASDNPRKPRVLTISYQHGTEARTGCAEVLPTGGLRIVDCPKEENSFGVGDAVAVVTKAVGIKPCGKCKQRQQQLNRVANVGKVKQLWLLCRYILGRGK